MNHTIYRSCFSRLVLKPLAVTCRHHLSTNSQNLGKWAIQKPESPGILHSPFNIEPKYNQTIPEFLWQNLHKWENAPAFECAITGRKYTHGQIYQKSRNFAASLKQKGFNRGDTVCILLPNMPEYPIATLGILEAGLVVSTMNPTYTKYEIANQINDCQGVALVTLPQLIPTVESAKKSCPSLKSIIVIGNAGGQNSFFDMIETDQYNCNFQKGSDISPQKDTAVLLYSSGTTGPAKGVEHAHSVVETTLLQLTHQSFGKTTFFENGNPQERLIAILPFFHVYGLLGIMLLTLYQGNHAICLPKFEPEMFIKAIKDNNPTFLHLVPPLMGFITGCKEITQSDLKEVHGVVGGATTVGKGVIERLLKKFDHEVFFQEAYGMTEVSATHLTPLEVKTSKIGSSGALLPGMKCKVIDVESGKILGANEPGEICVIGPQTMKGYYKNETATKNTIGPDGFLRTGDIGYYDDDSFFYIVDRLKELIKVKGFQVSPAELESLLRQHPEVSDVVVIGVKHEKLGEAPRAYIVSKTKSTSEKSIHDFLDGKIAPYKKLAGGVEFIEATRIPRTASGKSLRRVLVQEYNSKHSDG